MEKQSRKISLTNIFHFNRKNVRKKSELEYERKTDKEIFPYADCSCNHESKIINNNVNTRAGLEGQKFNGRDSFGKQSISIKVKKQNELPDIKAQSSNSSKESFDTNGFFSRYQSKNHKITYKSKKFSYVKRNSSDRSIGGAIKFIDTKLRYIVLTPSFPRNSYIPMDNSTTRKNNEGSSDKSRTDFKQNLNMFDFPTGQYNNIENKICWQNRGTGDSSDSEENSYDESKDQAHNNNISVQSNSNLRFGNYLSNDDNSSITSEKVNINPSHVDKTTGDNYQIVFKDNYHQVSLESAAHDMKDVHLGSSEVQQRTNVKENFELSHFSILKTLGIQNLKYLFSFVQKPKVFLRKGILKICSKFTGEHPYRSVISIQLQSNFIEIAIRHEYSPVNLLLILRTPFRRNTSGRLLLFVAFSLTDLTLANFSIWRDQSEFRC